MYLCAIVAMLGWTRWVHERRPMDLALMAGAMAAAVLIRFEAMPMVLVLGLAAGVDRRWATWLSRAATVVFPSVFFFGVWLGVQWILLGDPLNFLHITQNVGGAHGYTTGFERAFALPNVLGSPLAAIPWALSWTLVLAPSLALLIMVALARRSTVLYGAVGIVGSAAVFPAVQIWQVVHQTGFGDPRYFTTMIPLGFVALAWASSSLGRTSHREQSASAQTPVESRRRAERLVGMLMVTCAVIATTVLPIEWIRSNPNRTRIGGEYQAMRLLVGASSAATASSRNSMAWEEAMDRVLDPYLARGDKVILDSGCCFSPMLTSHHPDHFIIQEDRDFLSILDQPEGKFQLIVQGTPEPGQVDRIGPLINPPQDWRRLGTWNGLTLWLYDGPPEQAPA